MIRVGRPDHALEKHPQRVEVHRLGEVPVEAGASGAHLVFLLSRAGQRGGHVLSIDPGRLPDLAVNGRDMRRNRFTTALMRPRLTGRIVVFRSDCLVVHVGEVAAQAGRTRRVTPFGPSTCNVPREAADFSAVIQLVAERDAIRRAGRSNARAPFSTLERYVNCP